MQRFEYFYGWRVVVAAFVVATFAWGLGFYGPSVYVSELVRARGWPVAMVSRAVTFHFLFSAVLILLLAEAHDRFGLVGVTRAGVFAIGLGAVGWAHALEPWHLFPAAALTGFGWSALSAAAINAFIAPWFAAKRAVALSHAFNGASMGGVLMMPLWAALIAAYGFQTASLLIAVGGFVVLWPLVGHFFARTPADLGLSVDGTAHAGSSPVTGIFAVPLSRLALLRDWQFLSLSLAFAVGIFAQMGLITHLIVHLTPILGAGHAALAMSLTTACAMIGRIGLGMVVGSDNRRAAAAINFIMQTAGTVLLIVGATPAIVLLGCVLFGLGIGNLLSLPPLILQREQHAIDIPRALALLTAINQFVYAFAPGVIGTLRDGTGDYALAFALIAVVQLVSAVIVMLGRR